MTLNPSGGTPRGCIKTLTRREKSLHFSLNVNLDSSNDSTIASETSVEKFLKICCVEILYILTNSKSIKLIRESALGMLFDTA